MHPRALSVKAAHPVEQRDMSPAIVVLSSSLVVLYANHGGTAVLRELKNAEEASLQVPAPVLAYLADGILKDIAIRRMSRVYAPFSMTCSIQGPARIWHCQAFGLLPQDESDRSRVVFLFSDKLSYAGAMKRQMPPAAPSSRPVLLEISLLGTSVIS
jgi:hypothetical protein